MKYNLTKLNILAYSIIIVCLNIILYFIITTNPSQYYEFSIYQGYPLIFWISIFLTIIISQIMIVFSKKSVSNIFLWTILILLMVSIVLLLPSIRNYFIYGRHDVLRHIGEIKLIENSNFMSNNNFYPIMHILVSITEMCSTINLGFLTNFFPFLFSILFGLWFFLFFKSILKKYSYLLLSIIFLPIFGYWNPSMVGNMLSFFMLPLILYLWINNNINRFSKLILISILLFNLVFFHPLTTIYFFIMMIIFDISKFITEKYFNKKSENNIQYFFKHPYIIFILLIPFFQWYLSFEKVQFNLQLFFNSLLSDSRINSFAETNLLNIQKYQPSFMYIIRIISLRYGILLVLGFLTIISIILILKKFHKKYNYRLCFINLFSLIGLVFFGIITIISLNSSTVNYERILKYLILFSFPSIILLFYNLKRKHVLICFLVLITLISMFSAHKSPLVGYENNQVLTGEYAGISFFFESRNDNYLAYTQKISQNAFYQAIYDSESIEQEKNIPSSRRERDTSIIPEHYGYSEYNLSGDYFENEAYFLVGEVGRNYYQQLLPDAKSVWIWTIEDFDHLNSDITSCCVYANNNFNVFYIE